MGRAKYLFFVEPWMLVEALKWLRLLVEVEGNCLLDSNVSKSVYTSSIVADTIN